MPAEPAQLSRSPAEPGPAATATPTGPMPGACERAPTASRRVLDPIERISEVLFGLIMVLTFTCSFSVAEAGQAEVRALMLGALGCNLAWGIIDGIMYVMGSLAEKANALATVRSIRTAGDPQASRQLIAKALPPAFAPALGIPELDGIRRHLEQQPASTTPPRLDGRDWFGALGVFLLVFLSTFPVVIPFACMENAWWAQRISNTIAIALLFLTGYAFGRCTGYHPARMGIIMVVIGGALVALTIMLGG